MGVAADPFCHDLPVDVSSDGKADSGPSCVRDTGQVRETRESHKKPAAHVRGLRAHSCYERAEFSSAQIEIGGIMVIF